MLKKVKLNKIKNAEIIKHKRRTTQHKELLNLFNDLLDIILNDKTESESQEDKNKNENEKVESRKEENEYDDYENEVEDDDDETMDQNKKNEIIKGKNDNLDEIIGKSKSFEGQLKSFKKLEGLKGYWPKKVLVIKS